MKTGRPLSDMTASKLTFLEDRLSGVLKPIPPRKEFVHRLSQRIQSGNQAAVVNRLTNLHFLAVLIAGLISFAVLVAIGVRAVLSLTGKKHTLSE